MGDIRFDDRVAIVTGAGGGLGREHALLLASRGAKVVVNDLGGATDGTGGPAEQTVKEIEGLGGVAVADTSTVATVEGGQAIVDTALAAVGRVEQLRGHVVERLVAQDAGVADHDVDPAAHAAPLGHQRARARQPEAAARTGDDRYLVVESEIHPGVSPTGRSGRSAASRTRETPSGSRSSRRTRARGGTGWVR